MSFTIVKFFYILFTTVKAFYQRQIPSVTTADPSFEQLEPGFFIIILCFSDIKAREKLDDDKVVGQ